MTTDPDPDSQRSAIERLFRHGGDIKSARDAYPDAPLPWIDLSTGINPLPYPVPELPMDVWSRLPEPGSLEALQAAAAQAYGTTTERVAAAAGTQAILQALPHFLPARRVSILSPAYSEHERTWRAAGAGIQKVARLDAAEAPRVVIVNPNNPDGRIFSRGELRAFAQRLSCENRWLIVDEAFMDFADESIAGEPLPTTVVLRSFGKAYGLAGLRLGFAIAAPAVAARLRATFGPWPVSGPAIAIGTRALADTTWLNAARQRLEDDGGWLDEALTGAGFEIVGGTHLFRLVRRAGAAKALDRLCRRGVLTRPFLRDPDLMRFGIPTCDQRRRVGEALSSSG